MQSTMTIQTKAKQNATAAHNTSQQTFELVLVLSYVWSTRFIFRIC